MNPFDCTKCKKTFKYKKNLVRHLKAHADESYQCPICRNQFKRKDVMVKHMKTHDELKHSCTICKKSFARKDVLDRHMKIHDKQVETPMEVDKDQNCEEFFEEAALRGTLKKFILKAVKEKDPMVLLGNHKDKVIDRLRKELHKGGIKWFVSVQVQFKKEGKTAEPVFRGHCQIALSPDEVEEGFQKSVQKIYQSFTEYQREGSNWTLDHVINLTLHVAKYKPLRGSSYIELPSYLKNKKAIVNVKNNDQKCFLWSVLAALYPAPRNPDRVSHYENHEDSLKMTGISYPVKQTDIPKFEKQNEISINLFGFEKEVFPIHITQGRYDKHINLLLHSEGLVSHYSCIRDLNRLLNDQKSDTHRHFFCDYCLHGFTKESLLIDHRPYCQIHGTQKVILPSEDEKWLSFSGRDLAKELHVPYIVYADFECYATKIDSCCPDPSQSYTERLTHHVPSGFAYKIVGLDEAPVVYRGDNVADTFVDHMMQVEDFLREQLKTENAAPLDMSEGDKERFQRSTHCHICSKALNGDQVRDHCHITGEFRGAAHKNCNVNLRLRKRIPVVFHNLRGYDAHIIMQAIGKTDRRLECIPNNMEKYISFSMGSMDFIDSFQFMSSSLENLVANLAKEGSTKFPHLSKHFPEEKLPLLLRKGVYPYDYVEGPLTFQESVLPPPTAFYNSLTEQSISMEDYSHAQQVWQVFNIKSLGEYHDLYLLTDVLLLTDVFENFRIMCQRYYGLDPAHFYTSPGLAWQACLKMTGQRLELLTDLDMHLFIEKGLRGGISMISNRFSRANNPHLPDYDATKASKYIMYLDANNLYGWSMSQCLPTHGFHWVESIDVTQVPDNSGEGYILEVDVDYPQHLHDHHNDYPLAPEKKAITNDMLSPYCQTFVTEGQIAEKLVPNLLPKSNYVVHYRNLKQYLSLGMVLKKVHRVLAFHQSAWLKPYIDFNTEKRKQATNNFEKDFFKLMNNAVFGKTMENLRKHVDVKLVNDETKAKKLICKPNFHDFKIFNQDLSAIQMKKSSLKLNKPIYAGFSILDLSKTLMYDFHYSYIKHKYGSQAKLLFTDTDSLCYEIQTNDIYQDMSSDAQHFDTSDYHKDHPLYSTTNKKVLGKLKDECAGVPPTEFIGLRAKMYSLLYDSKEKKTAKGIKKSVVKNAITHRDYKETLFQKESQTHSMTQIRSFGHQLYTVKMNKTSLSPYDDKRYILNDGFTTLAYGHYKIPKL